MGAACAFFTFLGILPLRTGEEDIAPFLALGVGCDIIPLRGIFRAFDLGALARFFFFFLGSDGLDALGSGSCSTWGMASGSYPARLWF